MSKMKNKKNSNESTLLADQKNYTSNPVWFKPVMFGLMIIGLIWLMIFYISQGLYPFRNLGYWNIFIGFSIVMCGFGMTTRWRS